MWSPFIYLRGPLSMYAELQKGLKNKNKSVIY